MKMPEVYYGEVKPAHMLTSADVPETVDSDVDDDAELLHTPSAIIEMLGFDPLEEV